MLWSDSGSGRDHGRGFGAWRMLMPASELDVCCTRKALQPGGAEYTKIKRAQESEQAVPCTKSFLLYWLPFDKKNGNNLPQGCRAVSLSERWSEGPLGV